MITERHDRLREVPKTQGVHVPDAISRFLKSRGHLNLEDQIEFLNPKLKDLRSPFLLKGMDLGASRLFEAYKDNEVLGVYCDYDLDGSSAAAILFDALTKLGFKKVYVYQPRRLKEGYGFHKKGVDFFKEKGVSLIITADVGITAHETCQYVKEQGLEVIITDHHLPDERLPEALSIINPNTKECDSGLGHLCGAGVAFYLIYALVKLIKDSNDQTLNPDFKLDSFLDLLAIGTLTDMVPLIKENRSLVRRGLELFTSTKRPGLRALKAKADIMGKEITSMDIGFKVAPKLNSLSRLDTDLRPTDILIEDDREKAERLVTQAFEVNDQRVQSLQDGLQEALEYFKNNPPEDFCLYVSKNIHPGVMGLIATRVVEEHALPCFIGSYLESGQVVGSARLFKNSGLSLKVVLGECPSLLQYGGHAEAAGFELDEDKIEKFKEELTVYLRAFDFTNQNTLGIASDCEVMLSEMNREFLKWMKKLEPFGVGFEQPTFKISELEIHSIRKLKDKHYKMIVMDKYGETSEVLWFSPPKNHEVAELIESKEFERFKFNFYVSPQINFFRRVESLQLLLNEVEVYG